MEHQGTKILSTERLLLRPFQIEDAYNMFNNWASNPNVTKYLTWQPHENVESTKTLLESWISCYSDPLYYQWAIELKEIGQVIGSISVVNVKESINEVEIGYCIGENWWHKGYTSEAFKKVISFLFDKVKVMRIMAKHDSCNVNSGKVMLKCGLQYEGTLRKAGKNSTNKICDLAVYSILNYK